MRTTIHAANLLLAVAVDFRRARFALPARVFAPILVALAVAAVFVAAVAALYLGMGVLVSRARKWCPRCGTKALKRVNWFRCNPPPDYSFFACEQCGGEFVQVDRYDRIENPMIPRATSPWRDSPGWDGPRKANVPLRG